jgi:two-component system chemotaxis response regulator CheB
VRIVLGAGSGRRQLALVKYLEHEADLLVLDRCGDYDHVLRSLPRTAPDVVAVELDLLGASVTEVARRITRAGPARVVVLVPADERRSERALAALAAGAVAVVPVSTLDLDAPGTEEARSLRRRFRRLALAETAGSRAHAQPSALSAPRTAGASVIGICASTGGPQALEAVLGRLPADFPIPILVVQHVLRGFTAGLVSWLHSQVAPAVGLARDGQGLEPGVWFAPEGAHLVLDARRCLALDPRPPVSGHRPSGDLLLGSLAEVAGAAAVAVVLTGMGHDGAAGLAAVAASRGRSIAQDEASCVVYGMPRAAAELGAAKVLSLSAIGDELAGLAAGARR